MTTLRRILQLSAKEVGPPPPSTSEPSSPRRTSSGQGEKKKVAPKPSPRAEGGTSDGGGGGSTIPANKKTKRTWDDVKKSMTDDGGKSPRRVIRELVAGSKKSTTLTTTTSTTREDGGGAGLTSPKLKRRASTAMESSTPRIKRVQRDLSAYVKKPETSGRPHHPKSASSSADPALEWVLCDTCKQWRKLPPYIAASSLPETWYCQMNTWDPSRADCSVPADEDTQPYQHGVTTPSATTTSLPIKTGGAPVRTAVRLPDGLNLYGGSHLSTSTGAPRSSAYRDLIVSHYRHFRTWNNSESDARYSPSPLYTSSTLFRSEPVSLFGIMFGAPSCATLPLKLQIKGKR